MSEINFLPRMTIAKMGFDKKALLTIADGDGNICTIVGRAKSISYKENKFKAGELDKCFLGMFKAQTADGTEFRSAKLYLPTCGADALEPSVIAAKESKETVDVEFAMSIGVRVSDSTIGYEYTVRNLLPTGGTDPLDALMERALALPAPAKKSKKK